MQASALAFAALVYAGALARAWTTLPAPDRLRWLMLVVFPALYALGVLLLALKVPPLRRRLKRYVWLSFVAGFGQSASSVLSGLAVLAAVAVFVYFRIQVGAEGGRYPAGAFSAFGAGIGVLAAQLMLTFALEREPKVREVIEEADEGS
jgi:hypothetical protein